MVCQLRTNLRAFLTTCRMAAAVAGTVGGLYFVVTQDLGHGPGHDEDHHAEGHETHGKNDEDEPSEDDKGQGGDKGSSSREESKGVSEEESQAAKNATTRNSGFGKKDAKSASGIPDKKKAPDASNEDPKAQEPGTDNPPDKSDKVRMAERFFPSLSLTVIVRSTWKAQELQRDLRQARGPLQQRYPPQLADFQAG
jgi:hypothetical protein